MSKVVLLSSDATVPDGAEQMKFRLIYDGPLQPSQRDPEHGQEDPLAIHKQKIRKVFHGQLKRLWETHPFLSTYMVHPKFTNQVQRRYGPELRWASTMTNSILMIVSRYPVCMQTGYLAARLVA